MNNLTIAIVFDFDGTLAPDSTTGFLESLGIDTNEFWKHQKDYFDNEWDFVPSYMQMILEESKKYGEKNPFTRDNFIKYAKTIKFYEGVTTLFTRLKKHIQKAQQSAEIEFYIISSGIETIIRHSKIAEEFTDIWASEFSFDEKGTIYAPKRMISFTEKTRYLYQISKGLIGPSARKDPNRVNVHVDDYRVLFKNMIYIGDGMTDVPCFSLVKKYEGSTIAVHEPLQWEKALKNFKDDKRVRHLVHANYEKNSDLENAIKTSIDIILLRAKLEALTRTKF